jgi:Fic family protein
VVNRGLTIGGRALREHFEALNHVEAIDHLTKVIRRREHLTEELIRSLHRLVLKNIDDTEAGKYRRANVMIAGASRIPPQAPKVPRLMEQLVAWYHATTRTLSVPELLDLLVTHVRPVAVSSH